jgi:hypothetical protein
MDMNRFCNIVIASVVVLAAALTLSCSNETDTTLNTQQRNIANYLKGSHQPRLVPEEEIGSSLDNEPKFYTSWGLDIYRYISTYYAEGRDSWTQIEPGDRVAITYSAYVFKSGKPSLSDLFATNDEQNIESLKELGLDTTYEWTTEPFEFTMGSGDLLESLEIALEGCREGDNVEVYLTFEAGYGNKYVGMVPQKSAQMWIIDIKSVTKK